MRLSIQWNPSITDTFGEQSFGRYTEVAFVDGVVLCTNSSFETRVPGRYIAVGLSSGVAVKRGSTVTYYASKRFPAWNIVSVVLSDKLIPVTVN